jgi:hypothetical protein
MKRKLIAVVALLFAVAVAFAGTPVERLTETAQNLDETVQNVELTKILPDVARLLKTETAVVEKAIFYQSLKLSDVALGKFVSEKANQSLPELLKPETDWAKVLSEKKLSMDDAREYLDNLSSEVAFLVFENKNANAKNK